MRSTNDTAGLLKPGDVAEIFQVSRKTIYRWCKTGYLNPVRTDSGSLRFRRADVDALVEDAS